MPNPPGHLRYHLRFYASCLLGLIVWLVAPVSTPALRLLLAVDGFFASYLTITGLIIGGLTVARLRERAKLADEGMPLILVITLTGICSSLAAVFQILEGKDAQSLPHLLLAAASIGLGWLTFHVIMAFHYAHRFYSHREPGGLAFPGTAEPGVWDFLYHGLVIGMTAQVADVDVTSTRMRRRIMLHSVIAFFYNTVILALAVNVGAGLGS